MIATSPARLPVPTSRRHAPTPERRAVASAPMRVSLAGGGSDLPPFLAGLGGRVVGTAVDLRVRAVVEPFDSGWVRLELSATGLSITRRSADPRCTDVDVRLLEQALACAGMTDGVRLRIETDLVPGGGLGGSASAAVATFAALAASVGEPLALDREALVRDAVQVEREGLGLPCGSQDQIFAAHGGVLDLRFDAGGVTDRRRIEAPRALLDALEAGLVLVDTGQRRVSGEVIRRARYTEETTRELVLAAGDVARALGEGALGPVLAGMQRNQAAKVARDPAANAGAATLADALGPLGAEVVRMCGAGGGGHVLVWAPRERHAAIEAALGASVVRRPKIAAEGVRIEVDEV